MKREATVYWRRRPESAIRVAGLASLDVIALQFILTNLRGEHLRCEGELSNRFWINAEVVVVRDGESRLFRLSASGVAFDEVALGAPLDEKEDEFVDRLAAEFRSYEPLPSVCIATLRRGDFEEMHRRGLYRKVLARFKAIGESLIAINCEDDVA